MSSTVHDFDAWYDENVEKTIPIKLMGKLWDLPGDAPAAALLRIQRLEHILLTATTDEDIPDNLDLSGLSYENIVRDLVGDDLLQKWLAGGIKGQLLQEVSRRLYRIYTGREVAAVVEEADGGESEQGKAPAPKKKPAKKRS